MINSAFPSIQDRQRPVAVSYEARFLNANIQNAHYNFIGQSIFAQEMYRHQLKMKFDFLKSIWKNETLFVSNVSEITNNAAYRNIVSLGQDVLPFIFKDLQENDNHWFYALELLTGQNPIKDEHRGIVPMMKKDWIEWAESNMYINEA
jgi:hypothetical protein